MLRKLYIDRLEASLTGYDGPARQIVNDHYENFANVIFEKIEEFGREFEKAQDEDQDDKEKLNSHIMLFGESRLKPCSLKVNGAKWRLCVENTHHVFVELRSKKLNMLGPYVKRAKNTYDVNLEYYINAVIRRPLGGLLVRVEGFTCKRAHFNASASSHRISSTASRRCSRRASQRK